MIAVNVTGVFVGNQEAARRMKSGGRIIHIGSSMIRYGGLPDSLISTR